MKENESYTKGEQQPTEDKKLLGAFERASIAWKKRQEANDVLLERELPPGIKDEVWRAEATIGRYFSPAEIEQLRKLRDEDEMTKSVMGFGFTYLGSQHFKIELLQLLRGDEETLHNPDLDDAEKERINKEIEWMNKKLAELKDVSADLDEDGWLK